VTPDAKPYVLEPGDLAYLDTFAGMVPCRYLGPSTPGNVAVRLTATRGAYRVGEVFPARAHSVVRRDQYRPYRGTIIGRTEHR
jgi:hypothetical protein